MNNIYSIDQNLFNLQTKVKFSDSGDGTKVIYAGVFVLMK